MDCILDFAIEYAISGTYPPGLTKDKKRAVRKRAQTIVVEKGEVFLKKKSGKVCQYDLQALFDEVICKHCCLYSS